MSKFHAKVLEKRVAALEDAIKGLLGVFGVDSWSNLNDDDYLVVKNALKLLGCENEERNK